MGFYFNGRTSAKKMLYKRNKYSKAYVGDNLVHTGTTLVNYIDWKLSGSYIIVQPSAWVVTSMYVHFNIIYQHRFYNSTTVAIQTVNTYEEKYLYIPTGYNSQQTIRTEPDQIPSGPTGYTYQDYTIIEVNAIYKSIASDELYTYQFRNVT